MTKTIYSTILLILFVTLSSYANNRISDKNCMESASTPSNDISHIKIDKFKRSVDTVSYLMKYDVIIYSSRKSRMNNVKNYLKNPENLDRTSKILC